MKFFISTNGTVIIYDHWEDGYEDTASVPSQATTQVWGDRNSSNGCAPSVSVCTDDADSFVAGDSIVVKDIMSVPRSPKFKYDGGDRVESTFPISITRKVYPMFARRLLVAKLEVYDTFYRAGTYFGTSSIRCIITRFGAPLLNHCTQQFRRQIQMLSTRIQASGRSLSVTPLSTAPRRLTTLSLCSMAVA